MKSSTISINILSDLLKNLEFFLMNLIRFFFFVEYSD